VNELRRVERAYAALCACESAVAHAISEQQLLDALCTILVERGGYRMAWVGYAHPGIGHEVVVHALAGADHGYLEEVEVTWGDEPRGQGPIGQAIRTGRPQLVRDTALEPCFAPWRAGAQRRGFASCMVLPLQLQGTTLGTLTVYADTRDAFDAEERTLLERFGEDLAFGIATLRARQALERKDEQLRQAGRMEIVGRLSSGLVHDFRNLLMVVQGCGAELVRALPAASESRSLADDIVLAAERAGTLTRRILALGRGTNPAARVQPLGPLIEAVRPLLERILGKASSLQLSLAPEVAPVDIDAGHLEQILLNLTVNARDAMGDGGRLVVSLANAGPLPATTPGGPPLERAVELQVQDSGTGISEEVAARLFEPFFTTKPRGVGTGLGLSVVQGIVEHYGGQVALESRPGEGATFHVFFPAARTG
jgi:signal transduction histidine kinase